jgi:hypothetical protein
VSVSVEKERQFEVAVDWLKQKRGDANVVHCWHGSSLSSIEKIVEHGFGTFSNPLNGRCYGDGIYLGADAYVRELVSLLNLRPSVRFFTPFLSFPFLFVLKLTGA